MIKPLKFYKRLLPFLFILSLTACQGRLLLETREFSVAVYDGEDPQTCYLVRYIHNGELHEVDVYSENDRDALMKYLRRLR